MDSLTEGGSMECAGVENKWPTRRHLTMPSQSPSPSPFSLVKEGAINLPQQPLEVPTVPCGLQWSPNFSQQHQHQQQTTKPRPVFSPQPSYSNNHQSTPPLPNSEFHLPLSNIDLLVGTMNQRDQYEMDTPLNQPLDTPLPPPPPLLSGARLGAIIVL